MIVGDVLEVVLTSDYGVDSLHLRTSVASPRSEAGFVWFGFQYTEDEEINDGDKLFLESNDELYWDAQVRILSVGERFEFILSKGDQSWSFGLRLGDHLGLVSDVLSRWSISEYLGPGV